MLAKVEKVAVVAPFILEVQFNDGTGGMHDFRGMIESGGELLVALRDERFFGRVTLDYGAPTWPNGFDIAPEWLRREMQAAGELRKLAAAE